jgi:hypothetical protein
MRVFIVRPFNPKNGIDFQNVNDELIAPALVRTGNAGDTTQQFVEAGNIRVEMFEQLLLADVVIADISVHNANVFYELGIRHALRARQTILIRARVSKPRADRTAEDEVPFDLRTDRYLEYDHENLRDSVDDLVKALDATRVSEKADSPVFLSVPALVEQDTSKLLPVPRAFAEDVRDAVANKDVPRLGLYAAEVSGLTWEAGGWREVGRALFKMGAQAASRRTWERVRGLDALDVEANLLLGTNYQRLGDVTASYNALTRVLENPKSSRRDRAEAWALHGRNDKAQWLQSWAGLEPKERRERALRSPFLLQAFDKYRKAFTLDLNHFYPGLNALALVDIAITLIGELPEVWAERYEDDSEAGTELTKLERERTNLIGSVGLALAPDNPDDDWLTISRADYKFLTAQKAAVAASAYEAAATNEKVFLSGAARGQLQIFADLDLKKDRVAACLARFPEAKAGTKAPQIGHIVLFAGHRVDAPGRPQKRFPEECVDKAKEEIRQKLESLKPDLGIAAAASGGDILFHEVCNELRIPSIIRLVMPGQYFVQHSVEDSGPQWTERFWKLIDARKGEVKILSLSQKLPEWLVNKPSYSVWQRANLWMLEEALSLDSNRLTVLALWDGKVGDGPGGTKDVLDQARKAGAASSVIDTNALCGTGAALEG